MTLLSLLFWLIAGGTLQVLMPAWRHMGQPSFPFVLGVVLFAALTKKSRYFVAVALLGGLDRSIADALASAAGARETRIALALAPTPDGQPDWDAGAALLADHGWTVRSLPGGGDALAAAWAEQGALR